jgi:hypothetical protein
MNNNALEQTLERLHAEQTEDEAQLVTLQLRVASRYKAIEGLEGLVRLAHGQGDAAPAPTEDEPESGQPVAQPPSPNGEEEGRPRGVKAVIRVMAETGKPWAAREMTEELLRRGWAPDSSSPEDAVRTAMNRAWKAPGNGIARIGNGYAYRPASTKQSSILQLPTLNKTASHSFWLIRGG